jgi:TonB family protein
MTGTATVTATVGNDGVVSATTVTKEDPTGFGFGAAASAAVNAWRFQPGNPGAYNVTMNFSPPDDPAIDPTGFPIAPKPVKRVPPHYPAMALDSYSTGSAVVIVSINAAGRVDDVRVHFEIPEKRGFGSACADAVAQWEFEKNIAGQYTVHCNFKMEGNDALNWYDFPVAPEPTHRVEPVMPPAAVQAGESGKVDLLIAVEEGGMVSTARIVDEKPKDMGFGDAAKAAVEQWRFEGARPTLYRLTVSIGD